MAVNTPFKDSTVTTTNHTANYDLPLWNGEDTTSWLTQMNDAMNKIDDGMVDAKSKALEVVGIAADAKKLADETKAESDESAKIVAGYNDRLTTVEEKSKEHTDDVTNLNTRCNQFDVELHSVQEVQKKTTADLATLAEKVDSNKEEVDGKIENLTTTVVSNKADADSKISTTNETVAQISAKEQALEEAVTSNTATIVAINKNVEDLDSRIDSIENAQTSQGSAITSMTSDIDSMRTRLDGDDAAITGLSTRMTAVEKTAQTTQTSLATLSENTQNSFTELDTRLSGDEEQIEQIDGRVTALEVSGSGVGKTILMNAKSDYTSSVTDSNGKAQFTGCTLAAYLYSDSTCVFTLSTNDSDPFVTGADFDGSIGLFDLTAGVTEIMEKFKVKYPDIAIVGQLPQHAYPIIMENGGETVPRYAINCVITPIFSATAQRMGITPSYALEFSALSGGNVAIKYGFVSGEHRYKIGSKTNFLLTSVIVSGV